ncbi:related to Tctex2-related inner arm dynein light chain [Sporisorium reilianum SRZ2]|uniref:Related to Tctex2-related inner arm dynein light chain n=2 Tax=Sporisorium reilianum TaxID=72558 RepID=E6ZWL7_SPORE|nr:related to Tctex2-related inner arm dynein light chain [Sporisorium reilianum SRZ2]SJX66662.1 related to Tctex2-related inner arm dynein light chain [Sporisorium reilianum f. sp. reilianum]
MTTLASAAAPSSSSEAAPQPRHSASSSTSAVSGAASPVGPSSSSHPPRTRFDAAQLQPHLSSTLAQRLRNASWDKSDKEKNRALSRSIAEVVKSKMLEIEPRGFKYIVQVQLVENLGQGGSRPRMSLGRHRQRGAGHVLQH